MPKKNRFAKESELCRKCYYRWEFIRRNENYRKDHLNFVSLYGQWFRQRSVNLADITGYDSFYLQEFETGIFQDTEDKAFYLETITPHIEAFLQKWGVQWPCRPDFSFDPSDSDLYSHLQKLDFADFRAVPILDLKTSLPIDAPIEEIAEEIRHQLSMTPGDVLRAMKAARKPRRKVKNDRFAFFVVPDLGRKKNIRRLSEFMTELEEKQKSSGVKHRAKRTELKKYDDYLCVWDLKQSNRKLPWVEIARQLYASEYDIYQSRKDAGVRNPIIQRVIDQYQTAERLISGGFQEIK